ncbi:MAG TPA: STN domain-containing protein, partial [Steroidobacteraceae bacterium]|nr:STN domain-containing protein [Steroidobacteraceae bacterium]
MILSLAARGASPADARHHFDLRAGDAAEMLNEFSRQSNLQVLFDFNLLRGIRTHEVHGVLEPSAALATMLADTKLVVEFVNERTVTVSAQPEEHAKPLIPHRRQAQARATEAVEYGPPRPEALAQVLISSAT